MRSLLLALPAAFVLASCQTTPTAQPDRFATADVNKDGKLTRAEVNDSFATDLFTGRDTNGDGKITKEEWNPQISAADAATFAKIDANKDGYVTLAEAKAYARKSGTYTADFNKADTNKDGTISREEAVAYYASVEGAAR